MCRYDDTPHIPIRTCSGKTSQMLLMRIADLTQTGIKYTSIWFIHGKKAIFIDSWNMKSIPLQSFNFIFVFYHLRLQK